MVVTNRLVSLDDGLGLPADAIAHHIDCACGLYPGLRLTPDSPSFLLGRGYADGVRFRIAAICPEHIAMWHHTGDRTPGMDERFVFVSVEPLLPGRVLAPDEVQQIADAIVLWGTEGPMDTSGYAVALPSEPSGHIPVDVTRWAMPVDCAETMTAFAVLGGADSGTVLWSIDVDDLLVRDPYPPPDDGSWFPL